MSNRARHKPPLFGINCQAGSAFFNVADSNTGLTAVQTLFPQIDFLDSLRMEVSWSAYEATYVDRDKSIDGIGTTTSGYWQLRDRIFPVLDAWLMPGGTRNHKHHVVFNMLRCPVWAAKGHVNSDGSYVALKTEAVDPTEFTRWCTKWATMILNRYGDDAVIAFEIWNEPNHSGFYTLHDGETLGLVSDLAEFTVAGANALRAVLPKASIIGGDVTETDTDYLARIMADPTNGANVIATVDGWSLHPYGSPSDCDPLESPWYASGRQYRPLQLSQMEKISKTRSNPLGGGDVWLTEFGWQLHDNGEQTYTAWTGTTGSTVTLNPSLGPNFPLDGRQGWNCKLANHTTVDVNAITDAHTLTTKNPHGGAPGDTIAITPKAWLRGVTDVQAACNLDRFIERVVSSYPMVKGMLYFTLWRNDSNPAVCSENSRGIFTGTQASSLVPNAPLIAVLKKWATMDYYGVE